MHRFEFDFCVDTDAFGQVSFLSFFFGTCCVMQPLLSIGRAACWRPSSARNTVHTTVGVGVWSDLTRRRLPDIRMNKELTAIRLNLIRTAQDVQQRTSPLQTRARANRSKFWIAYLTPVGDWVMEPWTGRGRRDRRSIDR